MRNLLNSTEIATIFLDGELRVKRYTERARDLVRLIESDIGRPLSDLTSSLRYDALLADCQGVLRTLIPVEREVQDEEGRWHLVRVIPYRRADNVIDGLVLTVVDIDATKKAEERARAGREHFRSIVQTVREPTLMLNAELRVVQANPAFLKLFVIPAEQVEGRLIYELGSGQWNIPRLRELLERILPDHTVIEDFRVEHDFPGIGQRTFLLNARLLPVPDGDKALIIMAFEDVTPRRTG
jgi:two-component system CheB/CheR fusion protein